jgi:hypothetical protein
MRVRHPLLFGLLPTLIVVVGLLVWIAPKWVARNKYIHCSRRINEKIKSLDERRPATIDPRLWDDCVAWASIAHCNICFSEEHASYEAMCRFEGQLDQKLKGEVDLATIEWIGDRLAETGPHGQRYMRDWREQWKARIQQAQEEETHKRPPVQPAPKPSASVPRA